MELRVGFGYDVHRLVPERRLVLGGVEIEYELGLLGHSDADCLLHAICDALLGAGGLGDIGKHFPDTDRRFKDVSSLFLLKEVDKKLKKRGLEIINIDSTIVCQKPKLSPFIPKMVENISKAINLKRERINVKATTTEGLGFCGTSQGIACYAITSLKRG